MRSTFAALWCLSLLALAGCHSAYLEATIQNSTGDAVTLLEVDYPSASFGKELLPRDAEFHYRFKILGSGGTKVTWTDVQHHEHTVAGPPLTEGQEGSVHIRLTPSGAEWRLDLQPKR